MIALIFAGLIGTAGAAAAEGPTVDESFRTQSVRWSGSIPARMDLAWKFVRTSDGGTAICGAWTLSHISARKGVQNMFRTSTVIADGEPIHRNLSRFKRGNYRAGIQGSETRCIPLDIPDGTRRVGIDLGNGSFTY